MDQEKLVVRVVKDRRGRISSPRPIVWARSQPLEKAGEGGGTNVRRLA
jgi:hypothetical protein